MIYSYELDIAALVLYTLLILIYHSKKHIKDRMHNIFIALFICATLTPIFDIISAMGINYRNTYVETLPGGTHLLNRILVYSATSLYYIFLQATTFFFISYVIYQLTQYSKSKLTYRICLPIPLVLMTILIITNDFNGIIFRYDWENGYTSGPFVWFSYTVALLYLGCAMVYLATHKNAYSHDVKMNVCNIGVLSFLFVIFQILLPTKLILSFGFAVSMILLFFVTDSSKTTINQETGMMTREYLEDTALKLLYAKKPFSLILVRIADYSLMTSVYGVSQTEQLVRAVATKLGTLVNVGEAVQTNNSTFAFIVNDSKKAMELQTSIETTLKEEWQINDQKVAFAYLITTVAFPEKAKTIDELRGYITYFEKMKKMRYGIIPPEELQIRDRVREALVEKAIRRGLDEHNLKVFYQPMCTAKDQKFVTAEALVRLFDPELGFVSPAEFIPVAEHSGLMISVGNYVLDEVCRFIETNDLKELGIDYIEVNLSVVQCLQRDFMDILDATLERHHITNRPICFEITETASNCAPEIFTQNLNSLKARGFELAIDDFGSGYGNLHRMIDSSFDIIKFDKDMTQKACSTSQLRTSFTKLIPVFQSMGLKVVAEGVETSEQYEFLKTVGVDYIQGYYFSKPVPEEDFVKFLEEHK